MSSCRGRCAQSFPRSRAPYCVRISPSTSLVILVREPRFVRRFFRARLLFFAHRYLNRSGVAAGNYLPFSILERGTGFEPATICLEGRDSTPELPPLITKPSRTHRTRCPPQSGAWDQD